MVHGVIAGVHSKAVAAIAKDVHLDRHLGFAQC